MVFTEQGVAMLSSVLNSKRAIKVNIQIIRIFNAQGEIWGTVYLELKAPQLYLGMFAVSPSAQGKGIGKALLQEGEKFALSHQCNKIKITVISSRSELIAWYNRLGFVATGDSIAFEEIEGRFGDPKTDDIRLIVMEKLLPIS